MTRAITASAILWTLLAGTRLIDREGTTLELFIVEGLDRLLGFIRRTHFNETKTAWFARSAVHNDVNGYDFARRAEMILEIVFGRVVIDVTDE